MGTQILLYLSDTAAPGPAHLCSRLYPESQVGVDAAEGLGGVGGCAEIAKLPVRLPTLAAVVTLDHPESHCAVRLPP